jgi:hypothetical protein
MQTRRRRLGVSLATLLLVLGAHTARAQDVFRTLDEAVAEFTTVVNDKAVTEQTCSGIRETTRDRVVRREGGRLILSHELISAHTNPDFNREITVELGNLDPKSIRVSVPAVQKGCTPKTYWLLASPRRGKSIPSVNAAGRSTTVKSLSLVFPDRASAERAAAALKRAAALATAAQ